MTAPSRLAAMRLTRCQRLRRWWWNTRLYQRWEIKRTNLYCRFAYFTLMRSRTTGKYIIVWWPPTREGDPVVDGYYIIVSGWTPWGLRKSAENDCYFDRLIDYVGGRAAWCRAMGEKIVTPESPEEIALRATSRKPQELLP